MEKRKIFFSVAGRNEEAILSEAVKKEELLELFQRAAGVENAYKINLYSSNGELLIINSSLLGNTPETRYKLRVIANDFYGALEKEFVSDVIDLEKRFSQLECITKSERVDVKEIMREIRRNVNVICHKLETSEHISWRDIRAELYPSHKWNSCEFAHKYTLRSSSDRHLVQKKFLNLCADGKGLDVIAKNELHKRSFDTLDWKDEELLFFLRQMYLDLNLVSKFSIEMSKLSSFLFAVYDNYNDVPFHNFRHCFCVAQMMYALIWALNLPEKLGDMAMIILITACICHDLDHPGFNNAYQINAGTELALRYNDVSPLENHHSSVTFRIINRPDCNIFNNVSNDTFKIIRDGIIRCILATDMSRHNEILKSFLDIISTFDFENQEHKNLLCMILTKSADISNEARPMHVAEKWVNCLLQEFFIQSDTEKQEGLPVSPHMDRTKVSKPSSQCGFIKFILLPLFESLEALFPQVSELIVSPVRASLEHYQKLQNSECLSDKKNGVHQSGHDQNCLDKKNGVHENDHDQDGLDRKNEVLENVNDQNGLDKKKGVGGSDHDQNSGVNKSGEHGNDHDKNCASTSAEATGTTNKLFSDEITTLKDENDDSIKSHDSIFSRFCHRLSRGKKLSFIPSDNAGTSIGNVTGNTSYKRGFFRRVKKIYDSNNGTQTGKFN